MHSGREKAQVPKEKNAELRGVKRTKASRNEAAAQSELAAQKEHRGWMYIKRYYWLYLFLIPGMLMIYLFKIRPIYGLQIAFRDYRIMRGIWGSKWVGWKNFEDLFKSPNFLRVLRNSILTSILRLLWKFPAPIILALLLNEVRLTRYKKVTQTIMYLPHFISWVVVISMVNGLFSQAGGVVNEIISRLGGQKIPFLTAPKWFRPLLIGSSIWKESGWGTVIYLAALAGIDPQLYEAARLDGCNRWHCMRYITLPCIASTIVVVFILDMGSILNNGFEQIWLLQNSVNKEIAEVLETYSYQVGLREGRYSFATAIGMFQSLIGCIMVFLSNYLSKKKGGQGLW